MPKVSEWIYRFKMKQATVTLLLLLNAVSIAVGFKANMSFCMPLGDETCLKCIANDTATMDTTSVIVGTNITLQFCSDEINLDSLLTIADSRSVEVVGFPTTFTCKRSDTGIYIYNVTNLLIRDVKLVSCVNVFTLPSVQQENATGMFSSGIYIFNCTHVTIEGVNVTGSHGNGLTMFDNHGEVSIRESHFEKNRNKQPIDDVKSTGSGLHIVLSYCKPRILTDNYTCVSDPGRDVSQSNYRIEQCTFSNNRAVTRHNIDFRENEERLFLAAGFGRGGGLSIVTDLSASLNTIQILDCNFTNNSAKWGGGLYIVMHKNSSHNAVSVENCVFRGNRCYNLTGGAVEVGFQEYDNMNPQNNTFEFINCLFNKNRATFGGGVGFFSSKSEHFPNRLIFRGSNWTGNIADIGAAVSIAPQIWKAYVYDMKIDITFDDCRFIENTLTYNRRGKTISYKKGKGIVSAVGYRINFEGSNVFESNTDSAVYLTSSEVLFHRYSNTAFTNNTAFEGAGINMIGFSTLLLENNVFVTFENNSALTVGGAISQRTYDIRDFFASESCFIKYEDVVKIEDVSKRNITVLFKNNTVGNWNDIDNTTKYAYGHSIYATTIKPCHDSKSCMTEYYNETFNCIANFTFDDERDSDISTAAKNVRVNLESVTKPIYAVPGKPTELPIQTLNDLGIEVTGSYQLSVVNKSSSISIISALLAGKSITFRGKPGDASPITFETNDIRAIVFSLNVVIQECSPGYIHEREKMVCECSATTNYRFPGIYRCDETTFQALLNSGYWIGYIWNSKENKNFEFGVERYLFYADCSLGQCSSEAVSLPSNTSITELDMVICGESRTGVLCSKCRDGYATHYHSSAYSCKEAKGSCKWGWLLYIVSEIAPVTVFFVVVMVFNVKFTDGAVSGFILFVQFSDTMLIRGNGAIQLPRHTLIALDVYRFLTRIFNLNFFAIDQLSFCIWRSASTLDLLAFKYITILYASTLVVIIIVIFKYCHNKRINNILVKVKGGSATSIKSTIIHGMSGFLVICYSECTRISLILLTHTTLHTTGQNNETSRSVAFANGELEFFRGNHLFYALPALFIFFTLGILPPLMLISYPLCYKVLALLRINETKLAKCLCTCIPMEHFKPFFDSFQSSFKDDYRFISGFYFLYRLITLATFVFMNYLKTFYVLVQGQLAVILTIHALCQPYKKRWHNILDTLFFLNLSLINAVTLSNYSLSVSNAAVDYQHYVNRAGVFQAMLLYIPLLYIVIYFIKKLLCRIKNSRFVTRVHFKQGNIAQHDTSSGTISGDYNNYAFSSISLNVAENRLLDNVMF